ncbi:MAG: serine/threonine-protein kinase, partial [Planctomycetaceae bacterium]
MDPPARSEPARLRGAEPAPGVGTGSAAGSGAADQPHAGGSDTPRDPEAPAPRAVGEGGLGVEEALQLLARAWPQPLNGAGPSTAGDQIGRFTIDSLLGHGGFGIVYLAHDDQLRRWVALKIPRPHVLAEPRLADRLRREAQAAAGLDHPHIVPILETGLSGPLWYIAMQYCDGPTLAEWLHNQKQPVAPRMAARLVAQLAGALAYSHASGVIHGDLKPANVLLFPVTDADRAQGLPWTPRLTDFGLARIESEEPGRSSGLPRTGSVTMGTPVYMSPERIRGERTGLGPAGDIYALGVVLYELLIGRPPFQGTSFIDVADQARFVDPAPPRQLRRDVPSDLESICLKCLEKNPAARYPTAIELQADLKCFLDNRPT